MGVCHPDLEYCVEKFWDPLKILTFGLQDVIINSLHPPQHSLTCLLFCYRIFGYLNTSQMHSHFKDSLHEWISSFKSVQNASILLEDVDALHAAACSNLQLYVLQHGVNSTVYGSDFVRHLKAILNNKSSGKLLLQATLTSLVTAVKSQVLRNALVADWHGAIEFCKDFIMPHLMLREDDEMMFNGDWESFDSFELEEQDGLRRSACKLLQEIFIFQQQTLWPQIQNFIISPALLAYASDPANHWKTKDAALRFLIALSQMPGDIPVSMEEFTAEHIEPELGLNEWQSLPLLRAGVLRFLVLFKDKLTSSTTLKLFPKVVKFLQHRSAVVRYHAATYIKELVNQNPPTVSGRSIVVTMSSDTIDTAVGNILEALEFPDPGGHPYLLKCLMAVLSMVSGPCVLCIAEKLLSVLNRVCGQLRHPDFIHYLFEALSSAFGEIINKCSPSEVSSAALVISYTLKSKIIFDKNLCDLWHYSFQVLAQVVYSVSLLESELFHMSELVVYNAIDSDRKDCRPAMICLLRATLKRIPNVLYREDNLKRILDIPYTLLKTSTTYDSAFEVLKVLVEMDTSRVMEPYVPIIFTMLFALLDDWMQRGAEPSVATLYRKEFVIFTSLAILRYGVECVVTSIGEATERAGLIAARTTRTPRVDEQCFRSFTLSYWFADFCLVQEEHEVNVTAAAFSLFFKDHVPLRFDPVWCGESLNSILALIFTTHQSGDTDEKDTLWLRYKGAADSDIVPDKNSKMLLLESLIEFHRLKPDILRTAMTLVIPDKKADLLQFAADHNAVIA